MALGEAHPIARLAPATGLRRWLPALEVIRTYQPAWLPRDITAGLVLTAILVPVGMGYAGALRASLRSMGYMPPSSP